MRQYKRNACEFLAGSSGISVHWTSKSQPLTGQTKPYPEAVESFDLNFFMEQVKETGARHLIFTTTHGEQYFAGPNPVMDYLLPGHTCKRDLLGELAEALRKEDIRLIFYYNHSCNPNASPDWRAASGYDEDNLDLFASRILSVVECMSRRYGKLVDGWWFDSCYSLDARGPHKTVSTEMGDWRFPWEALTGAARSGNKDAAVTYNAGVDIPFFYTDDQDYYAGETNSLNFIPDGPFFKGLRLHQWTCLDNARWVHREPETAFPPLLYKDDEVFAFSERITRAGGAVTFNLDIDQNAVINPVAIEQIKNMNAVLSSQ